MAAAAGAPGSGEGGEAEPDSEPISGDDRPRRDSPELHGDVVEEAGYGEAGLRLPEPEEQPESIGPHWESEVEGPPAVLGVPVLAEEEPMQMGTDCNPPPAPCHGGAAPDQVPLLCASSPHPQVTSGPLQCAPEPVLATPDHTQVDTFQDSFPETCALTQDSPEPKTLHGQDSVPPQMQVSALLDPIHTPDMVCPTTEGEEEQDPLSRMETDPVPDLFLQVEDPTMKPEEQITPMMDLSDKLFESKAAMMVDVASLVDSKASWMVESAGFAEAAGLAQAEPAGFAEAAGLAQAEPAGFAEAAGLAQAEPAGFAEAAGLAQAEPAGFAEAAGLAQAEPAGFAEAAGLAQAEPAGFAEAAGLAQAEPAGFAEAAGLSQAEPAGFAEAAGLSQAEPAGFAEAAGLAQAEPAGFAEAAGLAQAEPAGFAEAAGLAQAEPAGFAEAAGLAQAEPAGFAEAAGLAQAEPAGFAEAAGLAQAEPAGFAEAAGLAQAEPAGFAVAAGLAQAEPAGFAEAAGLAQAEPAGFAEAAGLAQAEPAGFAVAAGLAQAEPAGFAVAAGLAQAEPAGFAVAAGLAQAEPAGFAVAAGLAQAEPAGFAEAAGMAQAEPAGFAEAAGMAQAEPAGFAEAAGMAQAEPAGFAEAAGMAQAEPAGFAEAAGMAQAEPAGFAEAAGMAQADPAGFAEAAGLAQADPAGFAEAAGMAQADPAGFAEAAGMAQADPAGFAEAAGMAQADPAGFAEAAGMAQADPAGFAEAAGMAQADPAGLAEAAGLAQAEPAGFAELCTVQETITEFADAGVDPKWVDAMPNSAPYKDFDGDNGSGPESFQERVKLEEVVENDRVLDESGQCTEVELFLQPTLLVKLDSPESHDVSLECQSDRSPEQESGQLVLCDSAHEDIRSPSEERTLEDAVSPMDSGISSELTSMEKELDSQSGHMETEPTVDTSSASYSQDVDYDPFYRDTKPAKAESSNAEADVQEEDDEASMALADVVQTIDLPEEPVLLSIKADTCVDNPDLCQEPPPAAEMPVIGDFIPGSEVQVTLDHIIQDALVVSFRHGDRIFSGVLMDLSKRFGPHGIPVTLHPKREYKNKPEEPIQPQSTSFQADESLKNGNGPVDVAPVAPSEPCGITNNNNNLWTSKPPPLFHEGAPYPPPLFIRDTYNQSIPQPPPRKIKRLKKKIYREEPTSIMNAIKLRPRQVLCDKCKNVVTDKREVRKTTTTANDSFKLEEGKRRRPESVTTVNKKLKTDHKVNGKSQSESQKKSNPVAKVSSLGHGRGKVVKVAPHAHTKKVLQSKNMDHAKAREVLKLAKEKAQKKQKEASSSKMAHSKVHLTRRIQNPTSGTLPPRLRIKPQRYRNEENDSSLKIGLESLRSSKISLKPQTRYTATRSAGEAPSEIKTPSNGPEEVSSPTIENASVCVPAPPPAEQDEQQALSKRGSKSNITVYMTLNQKKADSSSASVCSSDSTDDMKSIHSECSSTENFDFPPGTMHAPPPPSSSSSSSSSKEEKKLSNSLKIKVFSKNVSKCVTPDGRTICVGDIVWAKIYGFPWWPARILTITVSRKDNGLLVRQEASISWFGSPTTSFLALSQLSPFLENFQSRFNKKRKGLYRKAITEAAKAAKQLTPEVRALLTQFET
ncbi:PWWP domain-containing protein 2A [Anomaloglossus baeobatrachus]|uniref:PWWP domain-containing protein 2A n=1 Tax=Anomaloglossus baeobatrachus TaxID=238106 RepID=UPI003F4F98C5